MSGIDWRHPFTGNLGQMCSGCRRVLSEREDADGSKSWVHSADYADACPGGEPVAVDESVLLAICDFCSTPVPRHALMVKCRPFGYAYEAPETDVHVDDGQWAACEVCADMIRADQWDALAEHCVYCMERLHGAMAPAIRAGVLDGIRQLHAAVRLNMVGMVAT
jgi:hypothetical protein